MHKDLSDLNKVWAIKPLKMAGEKEARKILEDVAKQVQPIMYKHKWKVQLLSEFCPSNPALMGLNIDGGAEIKLRLRRQERQWDFFTYEQILDTMLHELCHNEHGPHNTDFYKLLDELRLECEELMAKGITGAGRGFDIPGRRLGGFSQPPPLPLLRQHALAAAERRAQRGTLLPSGPRRLGGDSSIKAALSPNQAAAMAAERRLHDDMWCGSKSVGGTQNQSDNASSSTNSWQTQDFTWPGNASSPIGNPSSPVSSLPSWESHENTGTQETWQCDACTLINKPLALTCEACETPRIEKVELQLRNWSCRFCTLINSNGSEKCSACGEWRYSYGPPTTGYTPHVGT
ncbi:DNA-dependent metalloprotease WSS1-like [Silene latifolia]|uniref:DNA-dependent metalloprotease WSS1-like n=1 Tax=Silene latifolia TaxID=37657 RepID=UPI003D7842C7